MKEVSYKDFTDAFSIFLKHLHYIDAEGGFEFSYRVEVKCDDPTVIPEEDLERLKKFNWHVDKRD